jgi:general secretion pathway protein G
MKRRNTAKGFTMVELMAVLIILGLLATLLVKNFMGSTDKARIITTKINLKELHSAVNQFKMDNGRFPTEDEQLNPLIHQPSDITNWPTGGYMQTTDIPKDGWGHEFIYEMPGAGIPFLIRSCGPDGQRGTDDDLLSTDAN